MSCIVVFLGTSSTLTAYFKLVPTISSCYKWGIDELSLPSPRLLAIFTCHCISLSLVSKAKTTVTSWQIIAIVLDSLSRVKPEMYKHSCESKPWCVCVFNECLALSLYIDKYFNFKFIKILFYNYSIYFCYFFFFY